MGEVPTTPPEQLATLKRKIKDAVTQVEYYEKMANNLADETAQFWMSMVQDEQLQQLSMQLHEVEV